MDGWTCVSFVYCPRPVAFLNTRPLVACAASRSITCFFKFKHTAASSSENHASNSATLLRTLPLPTLALSLASLYIPRRLTLPQTLPHTLPTLPHTLRLSTRVLSTLLKGLGGRKTTFALYLASSPFLGLVLRLPFHTPVVSIVAVTIVTTATPATPTAIVTTSPIFAAISRGAHLTRFLLPV